MLDDSPLRPAFYRRVTRAWRVPGPRGGETVEGVLECGHPFFLPYRRTYLPWKHEFRDCTRCASPQYFDVDSRLARTSDSTAMAPERRWRQQAHFETTQTCAALVPTGTASRRLIRYAGLDSIPPPLTAPLKRSEFAPFLDQPVRVAMVLDVPLETVADGRTAAFVADIAFKGYVRLKNVALAPVGAAFNPGELSPYNGRVFLLVVCELLSVYDD